MLYKSTNINHFVWRAKKIRTGLQFGHFVVVTRIGFEPMYVSVKGI
jgi:hypothetical protein